MTHTEFENGLRMAYREIALADHRGELEHDTWYLTFTDDDEYSYTWYPWHEEGMVAVYNRDPEKKDMTKEEVLSWADEWMENDSEMRGMATFDLWSFQQLPTEDQIAYIERLDRWDDVDAEFYISMCEDLGLDYHSYDDPDIMWADIKEAADEQ